MATAAMWQQTKSSPHDSIRRLWRLKLSRWRLKLSPVNSAYLFWPMADDVSRGGIGSLRAPCGVYEEVVA
eukprot:2171742-Prymnesium_polylepis.1